MVLKCSGNDTGKLLVISTLPGDYCRKIRLWHSFYTHHLCSQHSSHLVPSILISFIGTYLVLIISIQQKQPKKISEPENLAVIRKKQQEVDDVLFDLIDRIDDFMEAYGDGKTFPPHGTGMQTNQGEDTKPPTRKRNKKNPIQAVARGIGGFWKGVRTLPRKLRKKKPEKS